MKRTTHWFYHLDSRLEFKMCLLVCISLCLLTVLFLCVTSPDQARLCELEDQAKASKKGMWSEGGGTHTIRDMKYTIENPRNFVDSLHQKPINGNDLQASSLTQWHLKTHIVT